MSEQKKFSFLNDDVNPDAFNKEVSKAILKNKQSLKPDYSTDPELLKKLTESEHGEKVKKVHIAKSDSEKRHEKEEFKKLLHEIKYKFKK